MSSVGIHGTHKGVPERPKDFKRTLKRLVSYVRPHEVAIAISIICAVLSVIFTILNPRLLGTITTRLFEWVIHPENGVDFKAVGITAALLVGLYLVSGFFTYLEHFIMSWVSQKIVYTIRKQMDEKVEKLPISYIDNHSIGEILSRIINDVDTISLSLHESMTQIIKSVITIAGIVVIMMSINFNMTAITLFMLPISFWITYIITKKSQKHFTAQQRLLGDYNVHIEETYAGNTIIKAFAHEKKSKEKFDELNKELAKHGLKSVFISGIIMPLLNIVSNISYVALAIAGSFLAINGKLSVGDIQAFIQYSKQFNMPMNQAANISSILQSTIAAAERVFEFLDEQEETDIAENKIQHPKGEVDFSRVYFSYDNNSEVIHGLDLYVKQGHSIAIVGRTGAGKTTLVNLLMRFYDVNSGVISIDGINIAKVSRQEVREIFGMVLQDTWLFHGTIYENIAYGKEKATKEEVEKAAKLARADYFINSFKMGYDTVINEDGGNLSGGQKQLITIARVILKDPKILILDEATSSVDTRTEFLIQKGMESLMEGRTSFIIAHRLSTVREANCILVMDDGNIVEMGTHDELIKNGGAYKKLYESQF